MLNYEFPPMGGGAGNATDNISKELVKLGQNVTVLTSYYGDQKRSEIKEGVHIHRVFSWRKGIYDCGFRGSYSYLLSAMIKLMFLKKNNHYDVIHYFFSLPTGLLSLIPGLHRKTPYIVSLRGSDVPYYDRHNKTVHFFNLLLRPVNKFIWKRASKVVALSDGLKETALRTAINQEMISIPNGVETELFVPTIRENKNCEDKLKFITVSRLINRKGIDHVLNALAALGDKSLSYLIVGTGNYESKLKKMTRVLNLEDIVTFYGYCSREKLPELYNQSDVFILPSLAESFGMVFAEAMACGLPIIGGRTGGVPDLVRKENGILVEPGNVDEIKDAIVKMKNSAQMRSTMGQLNRKRVELHYSWRSVAQKYLVIYENLN